MHGIGGEKEGGKTFVAFVFLLFIYLFTCFLFGLYKNRFIQMYVGVIFFVHMIWTLFIQII